MSEIAGNIPRKFNNFRHLGIESSPHKLPEERESDYCQNVAGMDEADTVEIGETSSSPAKVSSSLQVAPMGAESIGAKLRGEDRILIIAEKDCVLTSSHDDMEDLKAFVTERLQCLSEGSVEKLIGDESVTLEEILCGNVWRRRGWWWQETVCLLKCDTWWGC